jgi:hypothetical protein
MNMLVLTVAAKSGIAYQGVFGDSCAAFLFVAGAVSMGIAGYLLYKAPKAQPVRYSTRRH